MNAYQLETQQLLSELGQRLDIDVGFLAKRREEKEEPEQEGGNRPKHGDEGLREEERVTLLSVKRKRLTGHQAQLVDLRFRLRTAQDRIKILREAIQAQPQFFIVSKAITDGALFNKVDKNGKLPEQLRGLKLESEKINPVYEKLMSDLITTKVSYDSLLPPEGAPRV